jgi:uncharacterized damage-inducible protein DinB
MSKRIVLLQALAATPKDLLLTVGRMPEAAVYQQPTANQWSISMVLHHLVDVEARYLARLQRVVSEDRPSLPVIHPNEAIYQERPPLAELLSQFEQARAATIAFLKELLPGGWQRSAVHETWGETKLRFLVQHLVDHDTQHLNQILETQQQLRAMPQQNPQPALQVSDR